jgi:hypothetical protein
MVEHILARLDGNKLFKRYVTLLVQLAHFDNKFSSAHSHSEIAGAAILVACDFFGLSPLDLLSTAWLTERAARSAETLQIIAARHHLLGVGHSVPSSPRNVDAESEAPPM